MNIICVYSNLGACDLHCIYVQGQLFVMNAKVLATSIIFKIMQLPEELICTMRRKIGICIGVHLEMALAMWKSIPEPIVSPET
jgi:hypothetical protein